MRGTWSERIVEIERKGTYADDEMSSIPHQELTLAKWGTGPVVDCQLI